MAETSQRIGKCRYILDMNLKQKIDFLNSFDMCIFGCDGVIWNAKEIIENAAEGISLLRNDGKICKFVSNNSFFNDDEYIDRFKELGINYVYPNDIIYPLKTTIQFLKNHLQTKAIFSLCSRSTNEILEANGFVTKTMDPNVHLKRSELQGKIHTTDNVGAVVLDTNFNLTFCQLAKADQYLRDEKCLFVVTAPDSLIPITSKFNTLGMRGFVNLLCDCSGKDPIIMGKPGPILVQEVSEQFGITDPTRVLFVGDNLRTDIQFGILCRFQTLFVLSGVSTRNHTMSVAEHLKPDLIARNLGDFILFFQSLQANVVEVPIATHDEPSSSGANERNRRASTARRLSAERRGSVTRRRSLTRRASSSRTKSQTRKTSQTRRRSHSRDGEKESDNTRKNSN